MKQNRIWKIVLACAMMFNVFALSAGAEAEATPTKGSISLSQQQVSVRDIVPPEYFTKYAGKFDSALEVDRATGFSAAAPKQEVNKLHSQDNGAIIVNSLDEYAALLNYFNDLTAPQNATIVETQKTNPVQTFSETRTVIHETTWNDQKVSWMKAYVIAEYDRDDKIVGTPKTDSGLYGVHPGQSWEHNDKKSHAIVNDKKTGGHANIYGDLSYYLIFEGIGKLITKELYKFMRF
ncbi:hypothetical protein HFN20_26580 [Paenibacillus dendritiformis]|uniref:hypothetical protein n=1 Tax=Paenibacillus dendritiformis TaxID=130049 RepID=UPI00143D394D|nr:hypothetical protein [Paenibacillus dendritiformis]NKI24722.1 hypothetical protein [Paenibacillus dendritiformis]NRG01583.1 hypothetical protein [Paenibacillus dendritiformis]